MFVGLKKDSIVHSKHVNVIKPQKEAQNIDIMPVACTVSVRVYGENIRYQNSSE